MIRSRAMGPVLAKAPKFTNRNPHRGDAEAQRRGKPRIPQIIRIVFNSCARTSEPRMYIRGFCDFDEARELGNICVTAGNVIVAGSQCGSFCTFCSIAERSIFMKETALLILAKAIIKFSDTN